MFRTDRESENLGKGRASKLSRCLESRVRENRIWCCKDMSKRFQRDLHFLRRSPLRCQHLNSDIPRSYKVRKKVSLPLCSCGDPMRNALGTRILRKFWLIGSCKIAASSGSLYRWCFLIPDNRWCLEYPPREQLQAAYEATSVRPAILENGLGCNGCGRGIRLFS